MVVIRKSLTLHEYLNQQQSAGLSIGFVPTMGALHEGHLQLILKAVQQADITVSSIFVNPAQFNDPADYEKYPSTRSKDILQLETHGTDILFIPDVEEIYPDGWNELESYDLNGLETHYEGAYRKGHFQGVCQVLNRLFRLVNPDMIFMGQKDYQQCKVVERLLDLMPLEAELIAVSTVRASDGLALSSRNFRLNAEQRAIAPGLYKALIGIKNKLRPGNETTVLEEAIRELEQTGFRVDYIQLAHAETLVPVSSWDGETPLVLLAAAWLNDIRLIDNLLLPG